MNNFDLCQIRKGQKQSQQAVAALIGISRQYYNYIERGLRTPPVKTAKKIAAVLEFDWTLFFEENSKTRKEVDYVRPTSISKQ